MHQTLASNMALFPDEHEPAWPSVPRILSRNESISCPLPSSLSIHLSESIPGPGYTQPAGASILGIIWMLCTSSTWFVPTSQGTGEGSGDPGRLWIPAMLPFVEIKYHVQCPWSRCKISYLPHSQADATHPYSLGVVLSCLSLVDHICPDSCFGFARTQHRGIPNTGPPP
jgi:hypothetical protein